MFGAGGGIVGWSRYCEVKGRRFRVIIRIRVEYEESTSYNMAASIAEVNQLYITFERSAFSKVSC